MDALNRGGSMLPTAAICAGMLLALFVETTRAAEWQWSVGVDSVVSSETNDHPRAFLWIPPNCQRVRAVVVGQHNMEEEPILEHPQFRETMAELGFAVVWITPGFDLNFRFDRGAGEHFDKMMGALAEVSGYDELKDAPVVPIGHSAAASFPWNFAAWKPDRTLAALSVSGQWPYGSNPEQFPGWWADRNIDGVPGLVAMGEYEWADENGTKGARQRQEHPKMPLSMLGCAADGHFAATDEKVAFLCLYLRKAAQYRLDAASTKLKPIDPTTSGWLVDRYRKDQSPKSPAATVGDYKGNPAEAFWFFDKEIALAAESFDAGQRGKKAALLGYVQDGKVVEQNPKLHQQVPLTFLPDPSGDGLTFRLSARFIDTVPEGRPTRWTGLEKGSPVTHPDSEKLIEIRRICGPVQQVGPDTWAIRFYRMGMNNSKRSNDIWFVAIHPGDSLYKRSVQQASMRFPLRNTEGTDQQVSFAEIPDQPIGTESLKLSASSSAGAPVFYYVREGPAQIDGDTLRFTGIPPRAKLPIKVTVVAWQWGRSVAPKLKSADPVERTFNLVK
jgi:hypothetical protein